MEKEFVTYELAVKLKALGFDEPCFGVFPDGSKLVKINGEPRNWNDNVINGETTSAPTFSQAFKWFREKYKLDSYIKHLYKSTIKVGYYFNIDKENGIEYNSMEGTLDYGYFKTYEEAELECLNKLIKIVKDGK